MNITELNITELDPIAQICADARNLREWHNAERKMLTDIEDTSGFYESTENVLEKLGLTFDNIGEIGAYADQAIDEVSDESKIAHANRIIKKIALNYIYQGYDHELSLDFLSRRGDRVEIDFTDNSSVKYFSRRADLWLDSRTDESYEEAEVAIGSVLSGWLYNGDPSIVNNLAMYDQLMARRAQNDQGDYCNTHSSDPRDLTIQLDLGDESLWNRSKRYLTDKPRPEVYAVARVIDISSLQPLAKIEHVEK